MISASDFLQHAKDKGYGPFLGVPCSFLKPFINYVIDTQDTGYLGVNNEGEAVAMAVGAHLAGRKPVVMFQNSGLGNTVNPLTSLNDVFRIPLLLITTWRGQPSLKDAPQHRMMGVITRDLLTLMNIKSAPFPKRAELIPGSFAEAVACLEEERRSFAFIMEKDSVLPYPLKPKDFPDARLVPGRRLPSSPVTGKPMLRREALSVIAGMAEDKDVLVATTGMTSRELAEYHDRPRNFYVLGSMGCASSVALGISLSIADRVICLDGDGAALMRLEAMVTIGRYRPGRYIHVVLDNQEHESTGGQATLSSGVDFPGLALACGYSTAVSVSGEAGLAMALEAAKRDTGPHFIHMRILAGHEPELGRPSLTPPELAERLRAELAHGD